MRVRRAARWLLALPLLATGCTHWHLQQNAPGNVDLATPPRRIECREAELPDDPGERLLVLSPGAFVGAGGGDVSGQTVTGTAGLEASLHLGRALRSHMADDFLPDLPDSSIGLNLGWGVLAPKTTSVVYGELQVRPKRLYAFAPGWQWDPIASHHGPQTTLSFGPFYLRAGYLLHTRLDVTVGIFVKGMLSWIWSR